MINKDHFTNGLIQVAIAVSLLRTDLNIFLIQPEVRVPGHLVSQRNQHETIFDSFVDYSRYGRWPESLKAVDEDRRWTISSLFSDLHSLSYSRRFHGVVTNIHTWLVSDTGQATYTTGSVPVESNASSHPTGSSHEPIVPVLPQPSADQNDSDSHISFPAGVNELTEEDMELINILYLQDIDIGIGRDAFDAPRKHEECFNEGPAKKLLDQNDKDKSERINCTNHQQIDEFPQLDLAGRYVIDSETGELVLSSTTHQVNEVELNLTDALNSYEADTPQPFVSYRRQSSVDQQWNDLLSFLNMSAPTASNDTFSSLLSNGESLFDEVSPVDTTSAVIQNASISSAAEPSIDDNLTEQNNFSLALPNLMSNYTSVFFDDVSLFATDNPLAILQNQSASSIATFSNEQPRDVLFGNQSSLSFENFELAEAADQNGEAYDETYVTSTLLNEIASGVFPQSSSTVSDQDVSNMQDLIQHLLHSNLTTEDLALTEISDVFQDDDGLMLNNESDLMHEEDWSSDSAVSSMNDSSDHQVFDTSALSDMETPNGAAGGYPKYDAYYNKREAPNSEFFNSASFSNAFKNQEKLSCSSNLTELTPPTASIAKNINHNHTYQLPHGRKSRGQLEEEAKLEREERATRSRDEKRAKAMKIPMTVDEIIDSSVEHFTDLLARYRLSEAQQQLVRDIRRRGKNKMAAQNCRKRKMEVIQTIEEEVAELRERRNALRRERSELDRNASAAKDKFKRLESELFHRLRDDSGHEYDPSLFSLLQTDDGGLFIVPRANATNESHEEKNPRKRKSKRKD